MTVCALGLFVGVHGCMLFSVSFMAQQVSRLIKGCQWILTSTNISIVLLKYLRSVSDSSAPKRHSGPTAHKNHSHLNAQNKKSSAKWSVREKKHPAMFYFLLSFPKS